MNKVAALCLIAIFMTFAILVASCTVNEDDAVVTPPPRFDTVTESPTDTIQEAFGDTPEVSLKSMVAYIFETDAQGNVLYGALEYENIGDAPLTVSGGILTFTIDGTQLTHEFQQPAYEDCIIYPGENGYLAVWIDYNDMGGNTVTLDNADLSFNKAEASRTLLQVEDVHIAENYPSFATVTGNVSLTEADKDCPLNIIHIGFYDENDSLIGVWYFTENVTLHEDTPMRFSSQMRSLPVVDLADNTVRIEAYGFGID